MTSKNADNEGNTTKDSDDVYRNVHEEKSSFSGTASKNADNEGNTTEDSDDVYRNVHEEKSS